MKKLDKIPDGLVNNLIAQLHNKKSKRDANGLISLKDLYVAVVAGYGSGYMEEEDIKATINALVCLGYMRYYKMHNGGKFYVTFKDVVRDENNHVIGVRWTDKRWWEAR